MAQLLCLLALGSPGAPSIQEPMAMGEQRFITEWSGFTLGQPESEFKLVGFTKTEGVTVARQVPFTTYACGLTQNLGSHPIQGSLKLSFANGRLVGIQTIYEDLDRDIGDTTAASYFAQGAIAGMIREYPESQGTVNVGGRRAEVTVVDSALNRLSLHWEGTHLDITLWSGEV